MKGHKGWEHSNEHNEYMSNIMMGRKSPMKGKTQTDEAKIKIAEAAKKQWENRKMLNIQYNGWKHKVVECPHCHKKAVKRRCLDGILKIVKI